MKAYIIRTQGCGVLHDRVFVGAPPSEKDVEAALKFELARHGVNAAGTPRDRWAVVQEVEVATGDGGAPVGVRVTAKLSAEEAKALREEPQPGANSAAPDTIAMSGVGTVTNPGE